jgi:hypothetical protein
LRRTAMKKTAWPFANYDILNQVHDHALFIIKNSLMYNIFCYNCVPADEEWTVLINLFMIQMIHFFCINLSFLCQNNKWETMICHNFFFFFCGGVCLSNVTYLFPWSFHNDLLLLQMRRPCTWCAKEGRQFLKWSSLLQSLVLGSLVTVCRKVGWWSCDVVAGFSIVVRAECWRTCDSGLILDRDSLFSWRCIPSVL